ncbi:MAG TPA: hypothetical protein V6D14_20365 [Coleofasciculaceae cyanobacterium]|jgi:hypothetical protein
MPLILAEFCGRWGCTLQENILNIILASLDGKSALILLGILLLPIFLGVLMLLAGLIRLYEFISGWGRALLGIPNPNKPQQQDDYTLTTDDFFDWAVTIANKARADYQQKQDVNNQAPPQQKDILEPDETAVNSISNEVVNNSGKSQPQRKRNLTTAKFLGRTLRNIPKN